MLPKKKIDKLSFIKDLDGTAYSVKSGDKEFILQHNDLKMLLDFYNMLIEYADKFIREYEESKTVIIFGNDGVSATSPQISKEAHNQSAMFCTKYLNEMMISVRKADYDKGYEDALRQAEEKRNSNLTGRQKVLSDTDMEEVREMKRQGQSNRKIGEYFSVTGKTIGNYLNTDKS